MLYSEFRPTAFDARGLGCEDRQDWHVAPVTHTRDTASALDRSNWDAQLRMLGGESETVEVHRFGHWGPGWIEIVLVHPDRAAEVEEIEGALTSYPSLDDSAMSALEYEDEIEGWGDYGWPDTVRALHRDGEITYTLCELLRGSDVACETLGAMLRASGREYVTHDDDGVTFRVRMIADALSRDEIARLALMARHEARTVGAS